MTMEEGTKATGTKAQSVARPRSAGVPESSNPRILFKTSRRKRGRETELVQACLEVLRLRGCLMWRNNTGATRYADRYGRMRLVRFGPRGSSDILGLLPGGRFLAVECKVGRNKPTLCQQVFLNQVNENGGLGVCVWSVGELLEQIQNSELRVKNGRKATRHQGNQVI
ncbi:MAG: hypothetical protein KAY37_00890 [Phycisphaerae bacterium]|nr:hypothetical protein [Phycisphaerae bacterium]